MENLSININEWEKEIDGHPAFMKSLPKGDELSDAMIALQAMKYDDDDDTLEEKALVHKDDGNKHFKLKKYRWAADSYTEGIRLKCSDLELNSILYANRAAAHVRLGNYRSGFKDCFMSRKFSPDHRKAIMRGIECLMKLKEFDMALEWIEQAMNLGSGFDTAQLSDLKREAEDLKRAKDRDTRKAVVADRKEKQKNARLLEMLKQRRIKFEGTDGQVIDLGNTEAGCSVENFDFGLLNVDLPTGVGDEGVDGGPILPTTGVHLEGEENEEYLVWPVVLIYPEVAQTDLIQQFGEDQTFEQHTEVMFPDDSYPEWDRRKHYRADNLEIFMESSTEIDTMYRINMKTRLKDVLSNDRFRLKGGMPGFIVLSSKSHFYDEFLNNFAVKKL